jgi:PKD repeat protein
MSMKNRQVQYLRKATQSGSASRSFGAPAIILMLLVLLNQNPLQAATNTIGTADGTFESGLGGTTQTGTVELLGNVGVFSAIEGSQSLLISNPDDAGSTTTDIDSSTLLIEDFSIDAAYATLRMNYNFLTNEPGPSFANDSFTVTLFFVTAGGDEVVLASDTFDSFVDAPWGDYALQTGFRTMVADVSAVAGTGDLVSLELRVDDVGDGRRNSAVFLDDIRLVEPGYPEALVKDSYVEIAPGELFVFDGLMSSDDVGIVTYSWDFGNGFVGSGPLIGMDGYTEQGFYQGTLTVVDEDGNTDTAIFTVVVGDINSAPAITSPANVGGSRQVLYRYQPSAQDNEVEFGDVLTWSLTTSPAGMTIDSATGLIQWTPPADAPDRTDVALQVADSLGEIDIQSFVIAMGPEIYVATVSDDSRIYTSRALGDGTWEDLEFVEDIGTNTRGLAIADFDGDDDFDLITGYGTNPSQQLFLFPREAGRFGTPVYLGPVGDSAVSAGSYPEDMAAEDFNNDGRVDFIINGDSANAWYARNTGLLVTEPENFFASDFETGNEGWGGPLARTSFARDDTTAASGAWSMRVFATATPTQLSIDINPSTWLLAYGSSMRFDYRIPAGTPVGLLVNVSGYGWVWLGGAPAGDPGTFPVAPGAVSLVDDDSWRSVEIDLHQVIREVWPDASLVTEFEWYTDNNATVGQQFWFDDFRITRPRMVSGFDIELLPSTGGNGRGTDAGDADGDGNMDFVRARTSSGYIYLYTGDGGGNFTPSAAQVADPGSDPYGVLLKDFDNDGVPDIIGNSSSSGNPTFFKGNGDGSFQVGVYVGSLDTNNYTSLGAYDFDSDGNMDVVAATYTSRQLWYYPGNGDGTFGARTLIGSTTSPAANILSVAAPAGRAIGQPFASATQDATDINEGDTVNFDASASYDDGSIVSYEWDFGDGNVGSGVTAGNTYASEGTYSVVLTLTDDDGLQDRFSLQVTVNGESPVADAGGPYTFGESRALLGTWHGTLDGTASTDADTGIASYEWDFDASDGVGIDSTQPYPRPAYAVAGVYTVTLTVFDEVGQSASTTTTVTVSAGAPPLPSFTGPLALDETDASLGKWTGWFDTSLSTDDVSAAGYSIDWGDGTSSSLQPLADDFSDGNYTANPVWNVNSGTWSVSNGVLRQTALGAAWRWLQDRNRDYHDFQLELDFQAVAGTTDGYMGIVFRNANTAGSTNTFLMYARNSWDFWRFYDWQTGTTLVDGGTGWDPGVWYHLRLVMIGDTMQLYVTPEGGVETLQIEFTSPLHPSGGIGLLANDQSVRYDNIKVTPLDSEWTVNGAGPGDFAKTYDSAATYPITLSVTDHAGQSVDAVQSTDVGGGLPPVADAGGPYTLDETDAYGARWNLIVDASGSSDDNNIERYTVDFGDGASYTTGFDSGSRGSYFATGTDLYGFDTAGADLRRVLATEADTQVEIIDLATQMVVASTTLNRLQAWDPPGSPPGDGIAYKIKATKPVVAYFTNLANHNTFVPSMDGDPVGKEFIFYLDINGGFYVYAHEDAVVQFFNSAGTLITQRNLRAGSYWTASATASARDYRVLSSGRISMQTTGNNGFTTVPSDNGDGAGRLFYFATRDGTTESIAAFAHEAADIEVFDLDSGDSLYTATVAAGAMWYQTGVGTRRMRLESTADVEVWAGDTQGSTAITSLGDDISFAGGRAGTEFVLHTLNDGVVIFAPNDGTVVDIDSGGLSATLQRDEFLRLAPADFPGGTGVHRITTSEPVVIQTLGQANGYNDLGSYLGGVSMRHQYEATGTYTLTLTTTDNAGQTDTTTTTVEVLASDPPVPVIDAPAVADETFAEGGLWSVEFDASGSSDDVGIFSYEWDFGDGTTGNGINLTHVYTAPGTYDVTLTVTDNAGQAVLVTQTIEVTFGDGPTADAGGPYVFGEEAASFGVWTATLDGTGSSDDAGIFDYVWSFDPSLSESFDAPLDPAVWTADAGASVDSGRLRNPGGGWAATGHYSMHTFDREDGVVQFTGEIVTPVSGSAMWGVFKAAPASFSYTQMPHALYFANGSLQVYENGSYRGAFGSYTRGSTYEARVDVLTSGANYYYRPVGDPDWILLYSGPASTVSPLRVGASVNSGIFQFDNYRVEERLVGPVVTRNYTEPTVENVTLTVRDNALQADSETTTITIDDGALPVADAGGPYTAEVGSFVNFNGTGSSDDTAVQHYDWTFGDFTGGPDAPGSQTANLPYTGVGATPRHFYQAVGSYAVELTVTDNTLKTDTAIATVDVVVGTPPVAAILPPTEAGANGPPAYFDGRSSTDDFGIVEYRWDFDDQVDRDGDGDFTNDIDAVGATPYYTYPAAALAAPGAVLSDDFDGAAFDTTVWNGVGATQAGGVLSITGSGSWGTRYVSSIEDFDRGRLSFRGQASQSSGLSRMMWGVKNNSTNNSYTQMPHAIYFDNGTLRIYENGSLRGTVNNFTYARDTLYDLRIDPRATGADYYMRVAGDTDWTLLTGYSTLNSTTTPLKLHAVIFDGTGTFDNFSIDNPGPYVATLTVEDGAGQTDSTQVEIAVAENLPPNVITVPWVAFDPLVAHETYNGKSIRLKGIVRDADAATYQWDFGDGTGSGVLTVTNPYDLSVAHTYPDAPSGTPFTATLTVTDTAGNTGSATYPVIVRPLNLTTEINVAIDEGLWYLHQTQTRTSAEGYDTGYWTSNARASATASAIQSFEINGHRESVSHQDDPYAETVMRGLRQLFRDLGTVDIAVQTYGEPDTNGNGIGIQTGVSGSGGQPIYQGGQVMDAIASSATPLARTVTGATGIKRRSYFDVLTDMADQYAWGQTEQGSGGAWRYSWNSSIDNSAAQWGAIGLLAAEDIFGIPVPLWVKERNIVWINNAYSGAGWGYTSGGSTRAGTPSALVQKVFDDQTTSDPQWLTGEQWIADNWNSQYIINPGNRPYYPYYALTKAMRLAKPEPVVEFASSGLDWFRDPTEGLARTLIDDQQSNGQFPGNEWITAQLRSAWGVIILSRTLFVLPPVADGGRDRVWGVDLPLEFDGSNSFHLDPFRSIVQYEWDFDGDGIFDSSSDLPTASFTYTLEDYPEDTLPQVITASLRVTDNNVPPLTDTDTIEIIVAIPPHPPVAEIGGPYTCTAGVGCNLDGTGSFDIDPTDFITLYEWDLDGFPFDYDSTTGATPAPVFPDPGVYDISLRVWDNAVLNDVNGNGVQDPEERLSDVDFGTVTVVANLPPVADANGPYTIDEGSSATLDATGSSDPNGDPLVYQWDLDDDGAYDDALGPNPSFLGLDDGLYPVAVRVTDTVLDDLASSTVTVNNVAPLVNAGLDFSIGEGATASFNGSFTDPGTLDTHTIEWDFGDGSGASGTLTPDHTYAADDTYTVTLTVTDDDGGVGSATVTVTVTDGGPTALLTGSTSLVEGDLGSFDASGSTSAPDSIAGFEWDFGFDGTFDASGAVGPTATNVFPEDGSFTVAVRVTDSDGSSDIATLAVVVDNAPPVVEAGPDQTSVLVGDPVLLAPAIFTDAGVLDTHTASIDWGDGTVESGTVAETGGSGTVGGSHAYAAAGSYVVTVTVTDDEGASGSDSLTVEIVPTRCPPWMLDPMLCLPRVIPSPAAASSQTRMRIPGRPRWTTARAPEHNRCCWLATRRSACPMSTSRTVFTRWWSP